MSKWTKGPWTAERGNVGDEHPLFVVAPGKDGLRPWSDGDARLIAAAPELFAALKDLLEETDECTDGMECDCCWSRAKVALAKARGDHD